MSERRTLPELLGSAMNSSALRIESSDPGVETSLLRIAALGAAVLHVQHGADRLGPRGRGAPIAEVLANRNHRPKELDQVAGELAGVLWHIRYAGQHDAVRQAIVLFADYVGRRARFVSAPHMANLTGEARAQLLRKFAERALHEWLSDRCVACGGSGKLERTESGSWVRPRGMMKRNAQFRVCTSCHGSRRSVPSHTARRKAIELTIEQYDGQGWAQNFRAALTWLDAAISRRLRRPLTVQLERSTKHD